MSMFVCASFLSVCVCLHVNFFLDFSLSRILVPFSACGPKNESEGVNDYVRL